MTNREKEAFSNIISFLAEELVFSDFEDDIKVIGKAMGMSEQDIQAHINSDQAIEIDNDTEE